MGPWGERGNELRKRGTCREDDGGGRREKVSGWLRHEELADVKGNVGLRNGGKCRVETA